MGVTPTKNVCGHSFFWSGAYEFTSIIIVAKKVNKEKFVILQSTGIIVIKSRETRL